MPLVWPVLTKEIHQRQRASLLQTHSKMESGLFDPLKEEEKKTNEGKLLTLKEKLQVYKTCIFFGVTAN